MQDTVQGLEALLHRKIMLYQELIACLKEERNSLVNTDMDALWGTAEKKQAIVQQIETIRDQLMAALSREAGVSGEDPSPDHWLSLVPQPHRSCLEKPYLTLMTLKADVRCRCEENKRFVEQSLAFLDELIGILANAGTGGSDGIYSNDARCVENATGNLLLHREV
ncbi:MAG: flagellar protein FlgN [Deltaproteobacteria bacterium]|nr:flagellar protein FlgN [Deltaproteobacteria bacterium]